MDFAEIENEAKRETVRRNASIARQQEQNTCCAAHGVPVRLVLVRRRCRRRGFAIGPASAGNDEIYGLWTLAFFVGFNVEADALPLNKRFQPRTLNSGDVNKHIAPTVVWFDETVAAFPIEEFDRTGHCH
jgi:hypothetical protein